MVTNVLEVRVPSANGEERAWLLLRSDSVNFEVGTMEHLTSCRCWTSVV